ncbi:hypothetical protein [Bradyrhizobium japonicum]|uniref:hypothetical protein n=1 Tax=Bradyrhizobium japonicum TaxID=375 RepID=UPI000576999F|nr:hypothetical protein [Bradyrhizobium japonicum]
MLRTIWTLVGLAALVMMPVGAEAYAIKQNTCYGQITGFCLVNCDLGTVVTGGGCYTSSEKVGFSANYPTANTQWACRPSARVRGYVIAYAICQ